METNKILNADVLDIIFDGRNKEYGAYKLRKNYNKRLATAMGGMGFILLVLFVGSVLANAFGERKPNTREVAEVVTLTKIAEVPPPVAPPPPPPPMLPPPPPVRTTAFTPPRIMDDKDVPEDTKPPVVETLADSRIGAINQDGIKDNDIVAPPIEGKGTNIVIAPTIAKKAGDDIFNKVENPARFPGGLDGWKRYLEHNLQFPDAAQEVGIQAAVRVQLIVDVNGNVSEVKALNDPGYGLATEAERVIKKGPKWEPAEQNGRKVTYRFIQTITFQMQ